MIYTVHLKGCILVKLASGSPIEVNGASVNIQANLTSMGFHIFSRRIYHVYVTALVAISSDTFPVHLLTLIPARIHIYYKVMDEIAYAFPNFNGAVFEVQE